MVEDALESISTAELGEMRREMLRILNDVDPEPPPACREDVCRRIQRLCRDDVIPEPIGDLMHLVRRYRNRAEYQDWIPKGMEALAMRSVWAAIDDWRFRDRSLPDRNVESGLPTREVTV